MIKYQQSKSGAWHVVDYKGSSGNLPKCQSFNLDKPNTLSGEIVETIPDNAKLCKKCASHIR